METSRSIKPELWVLGELIIAKYKECIPRMKKRSSIHVLDYHESLYAIFTVSSYRYITDNPIMKVNEFNVEPELSDEHSIVFTNERVVGVTTRIIVSFRGTRITNVKDIITDVFLTIGKENETDRFRLAEEKISKLIDKYPEIPIEVCGHSMGGTQAIYVSKKFNINCFVFNPAQGVSQSYINDIDRYPKIKVYRVVSDPISCIAGLENIRGITLFPPASKINMMKNHSMENFLPDFTISQEGEVKY